MQCHLYASNLFCCYFIKGVLNIKGTTTFESLGRIS
jgi:hypothetical protein